MGRDFGEPRGPGGTERKGDSTGQEWRSATGLWNRFPDPRRRPRPRTRRRTVTKGEDPISTPLSPSAPGSRSVRSSQRGWEPSLSWGRGSLPHSPTRHTGIPCPTGRDPALECGRTGYPQKTCLRPGPLTTPYSSPHHTPLLQRPQSEGCTQCPPSLDVQTSPVRSTRHRGSSGGIRQS